jgi:hypothetical protein
VQGVQRSISIHSDDKQIAQISSSLQISRMTDMHQIETTVRKDDTLTRCPLCGERRGHFTSAENFLMHGLS